MTIRELPPGSRPFASRFKAVPGGNGEIVNEQGRELASELTHLTRIRHHQDHAVDSAVASFQRQATNEALTVDRIELGLHAISPTDSANQRIPRPLIAGIWQGNLDAPAHARMELQP